MGIPIFRNDAERLSASGVARETSIPEPFARPPLGNTAARCQLMFQDLQPGEATGRLLFRNQLTIWLNLVAPRQFRRGIHLLRTRRPDFIDAESMVDPQDLEERRRMTGEWNNEAGEFEVRSTTNLSHLTDRDASNTNSVDDLDVLWPDDVMEQLGLLWDLLTVVEDSFSLREDQIHQEVEELRGHVLHTNYWLREVIGAVEENNQFGRLLLSEQVLAQVELEGTTDDTTGELVENGTRMRRASTDGINEAMNESRQQNSEPREPQDESISSSRV